MDQTQGVLSPAGPRDRIRILFLIAQMDTGGVQFQLLLRLRHLDPLRFDCRVAVLTRGESRFLTEIRALGVAVDVLEIDAIQGLLWRVSRVQQFISAVRPDVVDAMLGWDNTYGNLAATLAGVPFVIAELQNERKAVLETYPRRFAWFEALALRFFCDRVVCCSGGARRSYERVMAGAHHKLTVIHDAIDADVPPSDRHAARLALGVPHDALVVGTIGRLTGQKDHATLLRAVARVREQCPRACFVIGGSGPLHDRLVSLAAELGVSEAVRFTGEVQDPYAFYAASDLFVMSSRWEGFPVVLLEAMASGRPVVSTCVGGIREMITHGESGFLCDAGDSAGLARAISEALSSAERREALAAAGRDHVLRHFSIQELGPRWEALYEGARRRRAVAAPFPRRAAAVAIENGPLTARTAIPGAAVTRVERALLLRLCPVDRFRELAAHLRLVHPDAELDVLCQDEAAGWIGAEASRLRPVPYGSGRFTLATLGLLRLAALRRRRYDLVVVPYANPSGTGYAQAECAALVIGRGRAWGAPAWPGLHGAAWAFSWFSFAAARSTRAWSALAGAWMLAAATLRGAGRWRALIARPEER